MADQLQRVALVRDVFFQSDGEQRLRAHLETARDAGATLAVLPEIPCNSWSPATDVPSESDAEEAGGPREMMQREAAAAIGIAVVGGVIRKRTDGQRRNTALVIGQSGDLIGIWEKAHIPDEPGFREAAHYGRGDLVPEPIVLPGQASGAPLALGVQICSDMNRPECTHLLAAQGVKLVVGPRATEAATWDRWRVVLRANALTSCCWVASVNRPGPEAGVLIGGPSFAVAPDGEVLVETQDTVSVFSYDPGTHATQTRAYPGYLDVRSDLYLQGWQVVRNI